MLSQRAGGRGEALGPALSRPTSSPAEAPLKRSEMGLPLLAAPRPTGCREWNPGSRGHGPRGGVSGRPFRRTGPQRVQSPAFWPEENKAPSPLKADCTSPATLSRETVSLTRGGGLASLLQTLLC